MHVSLRHFGFFPESFGIDPCTLRTRQTDIQAIQTNQYHRNIIGLIPETATMKHARGADSADWVPAGWRSASERSGGLYDRWMPRHVVHSSVGLLHDKCARVVNAQ